MIKNLFLSASLLAAVALTAQDKAHRENIYGVTVHVSAASTNFSTYYEYLFTPAIAGNRIGNDPSFRERYYRVPAGGDAFLFINRKIKIGIGIDVSRQKGFAEKGFYTLDYSRYFMKSEYHIVRDGHSISFHIGAGWGMFETKLTSVDSLRPITFANNEVIPHREEFTYYLSGISGEVGVGYNLFFAVDRNKPARMYKQNCVIASWMFGASLTKTDSWKNAHGVSVTGPTVFNPATIFVRFSVSWGMIREKEVTNKGS